jgi:serine phosphatase RsbU (regulator of sigma subunit)/anti-sigma regulatory factor (Ser/Thr protein kinase)
MQPLILPATMDALQPVAAYVTNLATLEGLGKKAVYGLRLAVDEIVTNIVVHGYGENGQTGLLRVTGETLDKELVVTIEDSAPPFDPRKAGRSSPNLSLDERQPGGWGVQLALESVDEFKYERVEGYNRNIFIVRKPLGTAVQASPSLQPTLEQTTELNNRAWLIFNSAPEQALELALHAVELAEKGGFSGGLGYGWRNAAAAYWLLGSNALALSCAQKALNLLRELDDKAGQRTVLTIFAAIYGSLSEYEAALDYQLKALSLAEELGDRSGSAQSYSNIAVIYDECGQTETALEYQLKGMELERELGHQAQLSCSYSSTGALYLKLGQPEKALEYQNQALAGASALESLYDKGHIFLNAGLLYETLGAAGEAAAYFKEALALLENLGNRGGVAETLLRLGRIYAREGTYPEALANYKKALKLAEKIRARNLTYQVHEAFAQVYEAQGDFTRALRHYKLFAEIKSEVFNKDNKKAVAGMQIRFNVEKAEREREIFRLKNVELAQALEEVAAANARIAELNRQLEAEMQVIRRELQIGRQIQADFLPEALPQAEGWELAVCFKPAREVSGDFYDVFELPDGQLGFVVADVCDKGVGAALFMALTRSLVRVLAQQATSRLVSAGISTGSRLLLEIPGPPRLVLAAATAEVLNAITLANDYIAANHSRTNMFATLFFGVLDPASGMVSYINAGHDAPAILNGEGLKERLKLTGPAVGLMPGVSYKLRQVYLAPGDLLFAYTDGIPEARNTTGDFFTEKRLMALLEGQTGRPAKDILDLIQSEVARHVAKAEPSDDITALAIRRQPLQAVN